MPWAVFDDLVMLHLNVLNSLSARDWPSAFGHQNNALQLFNRELLQREKESNWFVPVLYVLCSDLRLIARIVRIFEKKLNKILGHNIFKFSKMVCPFFDTFFSFNNRYKSGTSH